MRTRFAGAQAGYSFLDSCEEANMTLLRSKRHDEHADVAPDETPRHDGPAHPGDHDYTADYGDLPADREAEDTETAREKFGGVNLGAAVFGWLVAVAVAVILTSVVGAVVAAIGSEIQVSPTEAELAAGSLGLTAAVVLVTVLLVAYYTGGYVAGRMSRFDGGKQGVAVWGIGLLVTLAAVGLGVAFGAPYNILDRVNLPRIPVPTDTLTAGGLVTAGALVLGTLLIAMLGGAVGTRYHSRVDRAARRTHR